MLLAIFSYTEWDNGPFGLAIYMALRNSQHGDACYSLRPKINAILGFEICPTKNATLTDQPQKTRDSSFSHKRQDNC
jgi:hypothetical protein